MEVNSNPFSINQLLNDAVLRGDVALLQELLQRDPLLLHRSSTSPIHMACKLGHVQFTWELLRLNASLAEEVDPNDKSTPLHVASRNGHVELVRFLISISPGTCFTRDMKGMNPVHVAAVKGHLHVLDEMLRVMPAAAREKAGPVGESIMHLCVKYKQVKPLEAVAGMVGGAEMLNAANGEDNTVLHVAVSNKQLEIVNLLLNRRVKINTPNSMGFTPMDLLTQANKNPTTDDQLKLALKRFKELQSDARKEELQSDAIKEEKEKNRHIDWLESQRSALMVVASLIATMAFQAGLNPPGGSWQDPKNTDIVGTAIITQRHKGFYNRFLVLNTLGLVASMSSILFLISGLPWTRFFVVVIMVAMWVAITAMTSAYGVALYAMTPSEDLSVVRKILLSGLCVWIFVTGLLFLGHITWWTVWLLQQLGRLPKKLYDRCF